MVDRLRPTHLSLNLPCKYNCPYDFNCPKMYKKTCNQLIDEFVDRCVYGDPGPSYSITNESITFETKEPTAGGVVTRKVEISGGEVLISVK